MKWTGPVRLGAIALSVVAVAPQALAQDLEQHRRHCVNMNNEYAPDIQIAGCNGMIESGRESPVRGELHNRRGDRVRAIGDFDRAISLDPRNPHAFIGRGSAHYAQEDAVRAIADFDQAIRLDPRNADAFFRRGDAYRIKGDPARAIGDFSESIRLNPKDAEVFYRRARLRLNAQFADAFYARGFAYFTQQDYARAAADHDHVIRLNPQHAYARLYRCLARDLSSQQSDQALADCDEALRLRPGAAEFHGARAWVRLRRGLPEAALADFDASLRAKANEPMALYGRGVARSRLGQTAEGQADMAAAAAQEADIAAAVQALFGVAP